MRTATLTIALLLFASTSAQAAEPNPAQERLYSAAKESFDAGNYPEAERILREALGEGELNIIVLSLGRALQKQGRCLESMEVLDRVPRAPAVAVPDVGAVDAKAQEYRDELQTQCAASLVVTCDPSDAVIRIDEGQSIPCTGAPMSLGPGRYAVTVTSGDRTRTMTAVLDGKDVQLDVVLAEPDGESDAAGRPIAYGLLAGGAATIALSAVLEFAVLGGHVEDLERAAAEDSPQEPAIRRDAELWQTTLRVTYVVGIIAAITGGALLYLGTDDTQTSLLPWVGNGQAGVWWEGRW